jgi:hypothetical protein
LRAGLSSRKAQFTWIGKLFEVVQRIELERNTSIIFPLPSRSGQYVKIPAGTVTWMTESANLTKLAISSGNRQQYNSDKYFSVLRGAPRQQRAGDR